MLSGEPWRSTWPPAGKLSRHSAHLQLQVYQVGRLVTMVHKQVRPGPQGSLPPPPLSALSPTQDTRK
jgi:hypothetical protein